MQKVRSFQTERKTDKNNVCGIIVYQKVLILDFFTRYIRSDILTLQPLGSLLLLTRCLLFLTLDTAVLRKKILGLPSSHSDGRYENQLNLTNICMIFCIVLLRVEPIYQKRANI